MSLGRGLSALITSSPDRKNQPAEPNNKSWEVLISEISADPKQPRQNFKPEELNELAESIKIHGVLQPILVREKTAGGYELIAGERRLRAAKLAGLTVIPALVKKVADREKLEIALIENVQRENLNPIEEAFAYWRLVEEFSLTQEEVAQKVGKSRPAVANTIRLLSLPKPAQSALIAGKISAGQARALLSLEGEAKQLEMLSSLLGQKITVRELERKVSNINSPGKPRDPNIAYLENRLRERLGAKVTINQKDGRGQITVSFHSRAELAEVVKKIAP